MVEFAALTDAFLAFVAEYGYVAFFVFVVLETSFILHFVPSEVVVPFAAALLVVDPFTFALFVTVATTGSIVGSLLAYWFGRGGDHVLTPLADRFDLHEDIERSKEWFTRYGEGLMVWGRLIPILRTPISIPAGFAAMHRGKFVAYSAVGWFVYNLALTGLVYGGENGESPLDVVVATVGGFAAAYPVLSVVVGVVACGLAVAAWVGREELGDLLAGERRVSP